MYFKGRFDLVRDVLTCAWGALTDPENPSGSNGTLNSSAPLPHHVPEYQRTF